QIARAKKRNELPAERTCGPGGDRAEYLRQWGPAALASPAAGFGVYVCALAYGRIHSELLYSVANNLQLQLSGTFQILSSYRAFASCRGGIAPNRCCIAVGRRYASTCLNAALAGRTTSPAHDPGPLLVLAADPDRDPGDRRPGRRRRKGSIRSHFHRR